MMKKKRVITALIAASLMVGLGSCKKTDNPVTPTSDIEPSPSTGENGNTTTPAPTPTTSEEESTTPVEEDEKVTDNTIINKCYEGYKLIGEETLDNFKEILIVSKDTNYNYVAKINNKTYLFNLSSNTLDVFEVLESSNTKLVTVTFNDNGLEYLKYSNQEVLENGTYTLINNEYVLTEKNVSDVLVFKINLDKDLNYVSKYELTNENGKEVITNYNYDTESKSFVGYVKYINTYDNNKNLVETITMKYANGSFVNYTKKSYEYNEDNKLIVKYYARYKNKLNDFFVIKKSVYKYNSNKDVVETLEYEYDRNIVKLFPTKKIVSTYDSNNKLVLEEIYYNYDFNDTHFELTEKVSYDYTDGVKETTQVLVNDKWCNSLIKVNGINTFRIDYHGDDNKDIYEFDESGNMVSYVAYDYENGEWIEAGKVLLTLDKDNSRILKEEFMVNIGDGTYQLMYIQNYTYDYDDIYQETIAKVGDKEVVIARLLNDFIYENYEIDEELNITSKNIIKFDNDLDPILAEGYIYDNTTKQFVLVLKDEVRYEGMHVFISSYKQFNNELFKYREQLDYHIDLLHISIVENSISSKITKEIDSNYNITKESYYKYDQANGEYVLIRQNAYTYDELNNKTSEIDYTVVNGELVPTIKFEYTYNHNKLTTFVSYSYSTETKEYTISGKIEYEYENDVTISNRYNYDGTKYSLEEIIKEKDGVRIYSLNIFSNTKQENEYDEHGRETQCTTYTKSGDEFVYSSKKNTVYEGNKTTTIYEEYDTTLNKFVNSSMTVYDDEDGSISRYNYLSEKWVLVQTNVGMNITFKASDDGTKIIDKTYYTYDSEDRMLTEKYQKLDETTSEFVNVNKTEITYYTDYSEENYFEYINNNFELIKTSKVYRDKKLVLFEITKDEFNDFEYKILNTYDESDNLVECKKYSYDGEDWKLKYIEKKQYENNVVVSGTREEFAYNINGLKISYELYNYDVSTSAYIPDHVVEFTYNENDKLATEIYSDIESNNIVKKTLKEYYYDSNNVLTHTITSNYVSEDATEITTKVEFEYDSNQRVIVEIIYDYDKTTSQYNPVTKNEYSYNESGNKILNATYTYNNGEWVLN